MSHLRPAFRRCVCPRWARHSDKFTSQVKIPRLAVLSEVIRKNPEELSTIPLDNGQGPGRLAFARKYAILCAVPVRGYDEEDQKEATSGGCIPQGLALTPRESGISGAVPIQVTGDVDRSTVSGRALPGPCAQPGANSGRVHVAVAIL